MLFDLPLTCTTWANMHILIFEMYALIILICVIYNNIKLIKWYVCDKNIPRINKYCTNVLNWIGYYQED